MRKPKNHSIITMPILIGFLATTCINTLIDQSILGRNWDLVSNWVVGLSIVITIVMLFIDFDADRFVGKYFRSEESYQNFLLNILIGVTLLYLIAVIMRWYLRDGTFFST